MTSDANVSEAAWLVEVFFDGACPLCRREIAMLRGWDRKKRIRFTDIASAEFDPAALGVSMERLMAEIHGRLPTGEFIVGVEVFRRLYGAVGFGGVVGLTRLPVVAPLLEVLYQFFARNRLRWTGRCDEHCSLPSRQV